MVRFWHLLLPLFCVGLSSACVSLPPLTDHEPVQLAGVPAHVQKDLQCGPASLASVLESSGIATSPEALKDDLFIPARGGTLQVELLAQTRQRGRIPLQLEPTESALLAALRSGTPVLVLLNRAVRSLPRWHYAVLTGFDPKQGYRLNSGAAEPETLSRRSFLRQWDWAGRWAISVHSPNSPPSFSRDSQWIAATAPIERSNLAIAKEAYQAAIARWPESALSWAALGGVHYQEQAFESASTALREAARLAPNDVLILNNLASTQLARGCVRLAASTLATARQQSANAAARQLLAATGAEIEAAGQDRCAVAH